jgi:general secretion pathway protein B
MSYILDALKKAERERDLRQVPSIMTVHEPTAVHRNRYWALIGVSVVCIGIAIWLVVFSLGTKSSSSPSDSSKASNSSSISPVAKQAAGLVPADSSSSPSSSAQLPGAQKSDGTAKKPAETKSALQSENAGNIRSMPREKATESARRSSQQVGTESTDQPGIEEEEESVVPPPELVHVQKQLRFDVPGSAAAGGKPDSKTAQTQPALLQEALGKMKMSLLYYSDNKAERTVFINGKKYREGDYVEGFYLLESITLEGAIFSYQDERLILRPVSR